MAIEDALLRLGEGSYGICDECGEEIGVGRLKVMPFTRLCVRCQEELEKETRMMKSFDDDRTLRRLPTADTEEESY